MEGDPLSKSFDAIEPDTFVNVSKSMDKNGGNKLGHKMFQRFQLLFVATSYRNECELRAKNKATLNEREPDDATAPAAFAKPVTTSNDASVAAMRRERSFEDDKVDNHS
jgi:hypothetical protein